MLEARTEFLQVIVVDVLCFGIVGAELGCVVHDSFDGLELEFCRCFEEQIIKNVDRVSYCESDSGDVFAEHGEVIVDL